MRKIIKRSIFLVILATGIIFLLNIKVTTKQGINYHVYRIKIPLYLKILDFYTRHYDYKWLVDRIINNSANEEEKVLAILRWTKEKIGPQPTQLRVVDDHAWNIIIRGYGTDDQFQDTFTTLCNYAGVAAFFTRVQTPDGNNIKWLSFVDINQKWCLFDAFYGAYFRNKSGRIASSEDLIRDNWDCVYIKKSDFQAPDYRDFFQNIDFVNQGEWKLSRSAIQSPLRRFAFWLKKGK